MTVAVLVFALFAIVGLMAFAQNQRPPSVGEAADDPWEAAARALGLTPGPNHMSGTRDGCAVTIVRTPQSDTSAAQFRLTIEGGLPAPLLLGTGGGGRIGDRDFDRAVQASGERLDVLRACDGPTRRRVQTAIARGWVLRDGQLVMTFEHWEVDSVEGTLTEGVALAGKLAEVARHVGPGLVQRVAEDPQLGVRRGALRALATRAYGAEALREALAFAVKDADVALRFEAAELAWDLSVMRELAADGHAGALRLLAGRASQAAVVAELARQWLAQGLGRTPEAQAALAFALGQVPVPEGEAALCELLQAEEGVQVEAARALGQVGTVAAVAALMPLRDRILGGESKRAAREAIAAIQARSGGAAGAMTLAEGAAGSVALAEVAVPEDA